jgi:cyclopropane-fatty-acyl-phospholipid synthase
MDGLIDIDGDIADLISLAICSHLLEEEGAAQSIARSILGVVYGGRRSLKQQKSDIAHHYDIGNDFFRLWLDESMTYSCAYFRKPTDTLEQAQQQKIDHSLRKLRLHPNETLLDIGSGWGSLVLRASEQYGAQTYGITLSEEQYKACCDAVNARGLEGRAYFRLTHYETLAHEGRVFDKIVSIGMIEHVGKAHLDEFVQSVKAMLKPGGLALLHFITAPVEGPVGGWINKYIFPNGYIPTFKEMVVNLAFHDFRVLDAENLGPHYRLTLDQWSERFEANVSKVREQSGEEFVRMWRLYLRGASASFRVGNLEVHQILVSNGQPCNFPLTREDIYAMAVTDEKK